MKSTKFNDHSDKPKYTAKPNPLVPHSWQIFEFKDDKKSYEPVGDYTLINNTEDVEITEKKLVNLTRILNGKKDLLELGNLTKKRTLYTIVPKTSADDPTRIIFKDLDGTGVSKENAVLTLEKGVLHEKDSN